jgi:prepilin-type processing-associated H-X9-DG protein
MTMRPRRPVVAGLGLAVACLMGVGCDSNYPLCAENFKQIGHALHEYHDSQGSFPKAAITDKEGKPGLSWRVAILPYLGQENLYRKFKLDEPWDSPHNQRLLESMPAVFACPSTSRREPSLTTYRAFSGNGAFLEPPYDARLAKVWWVDPDGTKHYQPEPTHGLSIAAFLDGTAITLMVVEAKEAVPWTKPEELPFDPARAPGSLFGAGSPHRGGFNTVFVDGAVRFIKMRIDPKVFRSMITRNGGEVVLPDDPSKTGGERAESRRRDGGRQSAPDGAMYKAISIR